MNHRDELLSLHNNYRKELGLPLLTLDPLLFDLAEKQANDMFQSRKLSHNGFAERLQAIKKSAAENVGYSPSATDVFHMWVNSPRHNRNLTEANYLRVGFGRTQNYWCAIYAA